MTPFPRWSADLEGATSAQARRDLVVRINQWRAANLIDVQGQRESAWALSKLLYALEDRAGAVREAQSLHSLCSTPPKADGAQIDAAEAWLGELQGASKPKVTPASRAARRQGAERPPKGRSSERASRKGSQAKGETDVIRQALGLGQAGQHSEAFRTLKGVGGEKATLARTWLDLHRALTGEPAQRDERLDKLLRRLERGLPVPSKGPEPRESRPAAEPPTSRVGVLLGREPSSKRDRALSAMRSFSEQSPQSADTIAEAALRDHVEGAGLGTPAPWLVGLVARALVHDGAKTHAALGELREQGAAAALAYHEAPFGVLVELLKDLQGTGAQLRELRRGIMRTEPEDRRIWTARFVLGDARRMVAVAAEQAEPPAAGESLKIAKRLVQLDHSAILLAPGPGHAELRQAAQASGLSVVEAAAEIPALLQAPPERPKERKTEREHLLQAVHEALIAQEPPSVDTLRPLVAPIRRARDVLDLASKLDLIDLEPRVVALVRALDAEVSPEVRLMQAVSMLLRVAVTSGLQGEAAKVLTTEPTAARFGGPGAPIVVEIAVALQRAGVSLARVVRGVTRREAREHAALDALAPSVDGLWRLLISSGEIRGEVWIAETLPPEGRGAVPLLALGDRPKVAVLPVEAGLLAGWSELGGPEAIGWTGEEAEAVVEAVRAWSS